MFKKMHKKNQFPKFNRNTKAPIFPKFKKNPTKVWKILANVMVLITPSMVIATFFAEHSTANNPAYFHDYLLLISLCTLALITDAVIVFGVENAIESFTFFLFKIRQIKYQLQIKLGKNKYHQCQNKMELLFPQYQNIYQDFKDNYSPKLSEMPVFSKRINQILTEWMGDP